MILARPLAAQNKPALTTTSSQAFVTENFIFACLSLTVNFSANSFQFNFQFLREHSHENLVFASSYFIFSRRSCRKASFSHLHILAFEDIRTKTSFSHLHMPAYASLSWRSCTKTSFSRPQPSAFRGTFTRKPCFQKLKLQFNYCDKVLSFCRFFFSFAAVHFLLRFEYDLSLRFWRRDPF